MIPRALAFAEKVRVHPVYSRILRSSGWVSIGAVVSRGLWLISIVPVARILGVSGFGEFGIIQSTVGVFGLVAGFGLGTASTKYVAEFRKTDPLRAGRIMALSTLISVFTGLLASGLLLLTAPWMASHMLAAPHLAGALRLGSPLIFLGAVTGAQAGVLAGLECFRELAQINFWFGLATCTLLPLGAWLFGLTGALWALIAGQLLIWGLSQIAVNRQLARAGIPVVWANAWSESGVLWSFSVPAILGGIVSVVAQWVANAQLVNRPDGYAEMGIFNATNQWRGALAFVAGVLGQALLPVLSELHGRGEIGRLRRTLNNNLRAVAAINVVLCVPLLIASPWIMAAYGSGFSRGVWVFVLVVIASAVSSLLSVVGAVISSVGRMWDGFYLNAIWAAAFLGFVFLLIPHGVFGLALALLLAYLVHFVTVMFYYVKLLPGLLRGNAAPGHVDDQDKFQ